MKQGSRQAGFSVVELIAMIAAIVLIAAIFLRPAGQRERGKAQRIKCVNNLKNLGLAARIFATDNNDNFPLPGVHFLSNSVDLSSIDAAQFFKTLSNELSTPKIIQCPADAQRTQATNFTDLTSKDISYFASLTAKESAPNHFLFGDRHLQNNGNPVPPGLFTLTTNLDLSWSMEMHEGWGNVCMSDGSVQLFSSAQLKQGILDQNISTNLLLIP